MRRIGDHFEQTQYRRMGWFVKIRDPLVHAIDRERVLNQIICSDTEKIDLAREHARGYGGTWDFDHCANLNLFGDVDLRAVQFFLTLGEHGNRATQFIQPGDHREHDFYIADSACAKNRAQLRFKDVDIFEAKADRAALAPLLFYKFRIVHLPSAECCDSNKGTPSDKVRFPRRRWLPPHRHLLEARYWRRGQCDSRRAWWILSHAAL